jgi:hypothetical protein
MKWMITLAVMLITAGTAKADNRIFADNIKSLTSTVNGDWMNKPVMELGSGDKLLIGFDELSHNFHRFTYRLEHCEWNWAPSEGLFESDWLEGFNDNPIEDYQNSINTTVLYTHYRLTIPNDRCRLRMSGNYRMTVYDEDETPVLQVDFYVVEPLASIGLELTTNTDVDLNDSHQQIAWKLGYNSLRVINTDDQLHTVVMQNWRTDNARWDVRPNYVNTKGLEWEHNRQLIFDAGNEFHRFEILDVSHTTMGLDRISWDGEYYQAWPFTAVERRNYLTDKSADGAFVIRNSENREIDYTCDYVWVNYRLHVPYQGDIIIDGYWTTDDNREHYHMTYDETDGTYKASILQKQGYYSYQFLTADGKVPRSEGSFYQTGNCYQIMVYYQATGERTWRLVGYRALVM